MKKVISMLLFCCVCLMAHGQVVVNQFKLSRDEPFGQFPGRKMLKTKFKVTSDKTLKYVKFHYYIVNAVGDVVSGLERGIMEEGMEYIKPKLMSVTGPMDPGKKYSPWISGVIQTKQQVTAIPYQIEIVYMGSNESVFIDITKDNYLQYFPKLKWIDYNRWNRQL